LDGYEASLITPPTFAAVINPEKKFASAQLLPTTFNLVILVFENITLLKN
jgi:hypothetical protein